MKPPIKIIRNTEDLDSLMRYLDSLQLFTFDTETTGLDPWKSRVFMMSFSDGKEAFVVPTDPFPKKQIQDFCQGIMGRKDREILGHNIKFDMHQLRESFGVEIQRKLNDTMIMAFLLDENRRCGLKPLMASELKMETTEETEIHAWLKANCGKKDNWRFDKVPVDLMAPYAGMDAYGTYKLGEHFQEGIKKHFFDLYKTEMTILKILYKMERNGVKLDINYLQEIQQKYEKDMEAAAQDIFTEAGKEFNPNSTEELGKVLYQDLGIPAPLYTYDKAGKPRQPSTADEALQLIDHPIIPKIQRYRGIMHTLSTFITSPLEIADKNGFVHGSYSTTRARTGRFSCSGPNLQNVKKDPVVRRAYILEEGKEGWLWDQSQIEMIGFAHYSKDPMMVKAIKEGVDLHQMTASQIFDVPFETVTKHQRSVGKGSNFSIVYGCGDKKLASFINNYLGDNPITNEEAKIYRAKYKGKFKAVSQFSTKVISTVRAWRTPWGHYVRNQFGRVRRIDPRNKAYTGVNHLIQGWARDLMGAGMAKIEKALEPNWKQNVHDAIRIDIEKDQTEKQKLEYAREIARLLGDFPQVSIPIRTTAERFKTNWAEAEEVEL